jgi:hypothetical protein
MFMKEPNHDEKQQSNNIDSLEMEGASDSRINIPTPSPIDSDDATSSSSSSFFFENNDTSTSVASDSPTMNPSQHLTETPTKHPITDAPTDTPSQQPVTSIPTQKPTTKSPTSPPTPSKVYDAVVIGSGWSGLRAAQVLSDSGPASVLILEANDYIGGRAKTVNTMPNNIPTDMGCEWLYTEYSSMVSDLDDVGLITNSLENDENMMRIWLRYWVMICITHKLYWKMVQKQQSC